MTSPEHNQHASEAADTIGFVYTAQVSLTRPATDYTPRLIPYRGDAFVPLELSFILWHDSPAWR